MLIIKQTMAIYHVQKEADELQQKTANQTEFESSACN